MIQNLRTKTPTVLVAGNHERIVQSILDFDFAAGRTTPSVLAIISVGKKSQKLFWGNEEILLPVIPTMKDAAQLELRPDFLLNITSASGASRMVGDFFTHFPDALGAHIFAENVAERDALELIRTYGDGTADQKFIAGPSGVGLCVPGLLKLGAIGGIDGARVTELGSIMGHTAIICSSGGMVNELMYQVTAHGAGISFAISYGGDRFPITSPLDWIRAAEADPQTEQIIYFGELGGTDEYDLAAAVKNGEIKKPIYAYIAGRYESGDQVIQFGHAKALAKNPDETASAKSIALRAAGVIVSDTFSDFNEQLANLPKKTQLSATARTWVGRPTGTSHTLITSPKRVLGTATGNFTEHILSRLLGRSVSPELVRITDTIFVELIDHGPHVSGAATTIITTRAGRDMVSSLATGILTIGDRFGGAMNNSAKLWHNSVAAGLTAAEVIAAASKNREHLAGIGHLKYNIYRRDARVAALLAQANQDLTYKTYVTFAQSIAELTTKKKSNLILNIDGAVAAVFLDYLVEYEKFTATEISELLDTEFMNALFVIPRAVGFIGHHLDQRRIDEGLFRLRDSDVFES